MASLPVYHSVPSDEKAPLSPTSPTSPTDSTYLESTGLRVGGRPSLARRARERYSTLSKPKKALVVAGLLWFAVAAAHKTAHFATHHGHHRHGHGSHHGLQPFEFDGARDFDFEGFEGGRRPHHHFEDEELTTVPTAYGESAIINFFDGEYQTANASFPVRLSRHRHLNLNFDGLEGKVIISRSDVEAVDSDRHQAEVIVESVWADQGGDVQMKTGEHTDALTLAASDSDAFHTVHVILPVNKHRVPSLSLSSTKSLALAIDSSAEDVHFRHLSVRSENGAIDLASVVGGELELETIAGDVTGSFNVSRALVLKTITGNIDAKVNVVPHFPPPHHKNGSHPPPPHHPPHHKGEHKGEKREEDTSEQPESTLNADEQPEERRGCHKAGASSWWPFRLFAKGPKGPKGPGGPHGKRPHGPKGPKGPHGPHGPGKHHGPPPPVFVGAFSTTGSIKVTIEHQPPFVSSVVKAFSHTGNVDVKAAKSFHGFYEAGSFKGSYEVSVPEGWKTDKVIEEIVGETGGLKKGLVFPKHHNHTSNATEIEFDSPPVEDEQEQEQQVQVELERRHFDDSADDQVDSDSESDDDRRRPPPPGKGKGPGGPGGKRPSPGKGPGGPPPSPGGKHPHGPPPPGPPGKGKGPGGPPPPPGKGHKGPGGPPPPPGGKHPHGPPPPPGPGGPHGPHGPHHPPPPPGSSKIIAHTDVGDISLVL